MIRNIIAYEFRRRFTNRTTLLIFLTIAFQTLWYVKGTFDLYVNEDVLMNAPAIIYQNMAGGGMLLIIVITLITGGVLFKDLEHKTGQWLYTLPVNEKQFLAGRFLAAFLINVALVALSLIAGFLAVPYVGIAEAHRFGPAPIGQLLHGFFLLLVPNLFLLTSLIFAAIVFLKKMAAGYLAVFAMVVFFLVMLSAADTSGATPVKILLDPFSYVGTKATIGTLSSIQKNEGYLPITGYLLFNRILWVAISLSFCIATYRRFSFKWFIKSTTKEKVTENAGTACKKRVFERIIPQTSFTSTGFVKKLFSLSALEFKNVVRPVSFKIIMGMVLAMILMQNIFFNANYYIGHTFPLTSGMTFFRLVFGVFIMILMMVWSGELFFKDKTIKIWQITDALPVPLWVTQLSRFIALCGVALVIALSFILAGIFAQLVMGGAGLIDLSLYVYDVLGYQWGWLTYVLQIALVFFLAGLTGSRFLTHVLSVGIFLATLITFDMGLAEQLIYGYAATPGVEDYSEISGYGMWQKAALWYFLMWALLATVLILLSIHLWNRGSEKSLLRRLNHTGKQLSYAGKALAVACFAGFVLVRSFITGQVNTTGNFVSAAQEREEAALYEKKYAYRKQLPQPKYRHIDLQFDYFPEERRAAYEAKLLLVNTSATAIDSLYLNFASFVNLETLSINGAIQQFAQYDPVHELYSYKLETPLKPQDSLLVSLKAKKAYVGFTQSGHNPQADLMYSGSFGSVRNFLPVIGYDHGSELAKNRERTDFGLPRLSSRMAEITDEQAIAESVYAADALWVTGTIRISTTASQMAIAPGQKVDETVSGGRYHATYRVSTPAPFDWYLASLQTEPLQKTNGTFTYTLLSSSKHKFNHSIYQKAIASAHQFIENQLGVFPYQELSVMEIPFYQDKCYAYPHTIAISEKEGWYADTTHVKERAYLYHTVASQMIRLWLMPQLKIANVQGAEMLKTALPEAISLMYLETALSKEASAAMAGKKNDLYNKERYNEANREPPLLYADGADYLEINRGAVALWTWANDIGRDAFITRVVDWVARQGENHASFKELYDELLTATPDDKLNKVKTAFEEVNINQ